MSKPIGPLVSSSHLVAEGAAGLSEFEFGLTLANNAFQRWIVQCMAAAGYPDLGALDVHVLHIVNHRERAKKLADICLILNIEDTHIVNYALKKLLKLEFVAGEKLGKENYYSTTAAGAKACQRYRDVRDGCLVNAFGAFGGEEKTVGELAGLLRALSGLYDQASRTAASL